MPANALLDVSRLAKETPAVVWTRCLWWTTWRTLARARRLLADAARSCCGCLALRPPGSDGLTGADAAPSNSDSEPDAEVCQVELVAVQGTAGVKVPAPAGCRDLASGSGTPLLHEDAAISDVAACDEVDGAKIVPLCSHHSQLYLGTLPGRQCSVQLCYRVGIHLKDGLRLCSEHFRRRRVTGDEPVRGRGEVPSASPHSNSRGSRSSSPAIAPPVERLAPRPPRQH